MSDTFKCASCKGEFPKAWTDEEAQAESLETFGAEIPADEQVLVCDPCYDGITERAGEEGLNDERRRLASIGRDNGGNHA